MGTYKPGCYTKVRPGEKIPDKPGAERWVSKNREGRLSGRIQQR